MAESEESLWTAFCVFRPWSRSDLAGTGEAPLVVRGASSGLLGELPSLRLPTAWFGQEVDCRSADRHLRQLAAAR